MDGKYSIRMAAQLSGLTPITIRTWENRYQVVTPERSGGNQRLYSDEDVKRLKQLSRAVDRGYKIGNICSLPAEELEEILLQSPIDRKSPKYLELSLKAVEDLNPYLLDEILESAVLEMGIVEAMEQLIMPMMVQIGEGWNRGEWQIYQEHMASELVKSFLLRKLQLTGKSEKAPVAVAAAPAGQSHSLGAAAAALTASIAGFRVIYIGGDTPAEDLVDIVKKSDALVLLLSIVFPGNPGALRRDLDTLVKSLPEGCRFLAGGSSARSFASIQSMEITDNLTLLRQRLQEIREERSIEY
ncbi:MAG: MerR family transcriptional regulator [Spirochaetales bacterium]|nr:MerR family transcriptional regulator [Spirochaetales bacterium]